MKKRRTDMICRYYDELIKKTKIPNIDFHKLPPVNKKRKNYGFIPCIIYACTVLLLTFAVLLNRGNQSPLEKHIDSLDQKYEISRLIPEGLENFNKIMHEYFRKGEKQ